MAKTSKPPEVSPEAIRLTMFVEGVKEGHIKADAGYRYDGDLRAVAEMIERILAGEKAADVLGLPDGRAARNTYHRDVKLARAVLQARETERNLDEACAKVADHSGIDFETVRDAYYRHKDSARAIRRFWQFVKGGK